MHKIFKNNTFQLFLGFILIAAGSFLYTSVYSENIFSYIMNVTTLPMQNFFTQIWHSADDMLPRFESAKEMEIKIQELQNEVRELRNLTGDYYDLKKKNEQYEKYLELKNTRNDLKFVTASAVGRDPSELFYGFTINRGTESGISEGDSVITENGLVGYVNRVEEGASRVTTLLSPDIKIGASDDASGDNGVISGNIKLCDEGLTGLILVSAQNSIKEGDIITSTGLSGMYPKNLLVGKVKSVNYDAYNSSVCAVVEPFENIKTVRDVLVIVGFHGKGKISQSVIQKGLEGENS